MPKPSMEAMLPDAAVTGALAGKFEVLTSAYRVHKDKEYEPKPGQTQRDSPKVTALVFKVTPLGEDNEKLEDADTRELVLKLGGKSLSTFHPGKASSADDVDPEDLGDELNTEGNTLYISGGEVSMHANSGYTVFMKSLQHRGFPKEKIAQCYAPNFKGMKFELLTVTADKLDSYGMKKGDDAKITYKVVQQLIALPGAKKAGKAAKEETATPITKGKKPAPAPPPPDDNEDDDDSTSASTPANDAEAEALRVLTAVASKLAGKNKKLDQAKTFWVTLYSDPKVKGSAKLQGEARKFVNDDKWLAEQLEELGCVVDEDEKTVTFAAA